MGYRYFKVQDPVMVARALEISAEATKKAGQLEALTEAYGCTALVYTPAWSGTQFFAGLREKQGIRLDPDIWRYDRKGDAMVLRRRPVGGNAEDLRKVQAEFAPYSRIEQPWSLLDDFSQFGISNGPLVCLGRKVLHCGFSLVRGVPQSDGSIQTNVYVDVPWSEDDKGKDNATGRYMAGFEIPPGWVEIRQWEKLRDIEEAERAA